MRDQDRQSPKSGILIKGLSLCPYMFDNKNEEAVLCYVTIHDYFISDKEWYFILVEDLVKTSTFVISLFLCGWNAGYLTFTSYLFIS